MTEDRAETLAEAFTKRGSRGMARPITGYLSPRKGAISVRHALAISMALAMIAAGAVTARAAGPYDGTWVVDLPAKGMIAGSNDYRCPAQRFQIQITDNQVSGQLQRVGTGQSVQSAPSDRGTPVTGSVLPDGTITASWEKYGATGKLNGDRADLTLRRACGTDKVTGVRVQR